MNILTTFYERFCKDEAPRLAASTAFYTLFAMAPLLLLMIALSNLFHVSEQISFISQVHTLMGPEAAAAVQGIMYAVSERAHLTSWVSVSSALVWAFSASLLFSELRSALTRIFSDEPIRNDSAGFKEDVMAFFRTRVFSLLLVFVFTCVAVVSLLVSTTITFLMQGNPVFVLRALNVAISFGVYLLFFTIAYRYIPDVRVTFKQALFGGVITSILFVLGKELIGLYLGHTAFGSVYGAAGTLVVMLIWIYYSSLIVFAAAELTVIMMPEAKPV